MEVTDKANLDYDDDTVSFVFIFIINIESAHNANYLEGYITIDYDKSETYTPVCPTCKYVINVRARITKAMNETRTKCLASIQ